MKRSKSKQVIDCVALKRRAQAKIHADTKGMSVADQIAYFRRRAQLGAMGAWWKQVSILPAGASPAVVREKPPKKYGS